MTFPRRIDEAEAEVVLTSPGSRQTVMASRTLRRYSRRRRDQPAPAHLVDQAARMGWFKGIRNRKGFPLQPRLGQGASLGEEAVLAASGRAGEVAARVWGG